MLHFTAREGRATPRVASDAPTALPAAPTYARHAPERSEVEDWDGKGSKGALARCAWSLTTRTTLWACSSFLWNPVEPTPSRCSLLTLRTTLKRIKYRPVVMPGLR